jgi:hypothetical protein
MQFDAVSHTRHPLGTHSSALTPSHTHQQPSRSLSCALSPSPFIPILQNTIEKGRRRREEEEEDKEDG